MKIDFGGNKIVPYTERQWNDYKLRMMTTIPKDAATGDEITNDPDFKQFVSNFVFGRLEDPQQKEKDRQNGITFKLTNMEVNSSEGTFVYPLVNEHRGHYVMKTHYFKKEAGGYVVKTIEVVPTGIIVPVE